MNPLFQERSTPISPDDLPALVSALKELPLNLREALMVRMMDEIDMFGRTLTDPYAGGDRFSLQVHVYPWAAAGATAVSIHQDIFGNLSVALVWNIKRDKRALDHPLRLRGIPDYWLLPEGYMQPKACPGGEAGISHLSSAAMDEAEIAILAQKKTKEAAYQEISQHLGIENQPRKPQLTEYDKDLLSCALKELREEVGLTLKAPEANLGSDPNAHVSFVDFKESAQAMHMISGIYLMEVDKQKYHAAPQLKPDNLEIGSAIWGALKKFQFHLIDEKIHILYSDQHDVAVEIPFTYALTISNGILKFWDKKISSLNTHQDNLFKSVNAIEAWIHKTLANQNLNPANYSFYEVMGANPLKYLSKHYKIDENVVEGKTSSERKHNLKLISVLGEYTEQYHQKIIAIGRALQKIDLSNPYSAQALKSIAEQDPESHRNDIAKKFLEKYALAKVLRANNSI